MTSGLSQFFFPKVATEPGLPVTVAGAPKSRDRLPP